MTEEGDRVEHVGSILMPVDEVVFSLFAAGDERLVRELNDARGSPRRPDRRGRRAPLERGRRHPWRHQAMTQVRTVRGRQAGAIALIAALAVAGCSSTGTTRRRRSPRPSRPPAAHQAPAAERVSRAVVGAPHPRSRAGPPNPRPS